LRKLAQLHDEDVLSDVHCDAHCQAARRRVLEPDWREADAAAAGGGQAGQRERMTGLDSDIAVCALVL
jgi:hypothetical protein